MDSFVISLAAAADRREHVAREFDRAGVPFAFFNAVTPATVADTAGALQIDLSETLLKPSELGCLLSHAALWQKMLDEKLDYMAVFEDDIHLGADAGAILAGLENWWPADAKIVKLERFYPRVLVSADYCAMAGFPRRLSRLHEKHLATGGYILSRAGAAELLAFIRTYTRLVPVDHIMFHHYMEQRQAPVYQMLPALCIQDHIYKGKDGTLPSHLSDERDQRLGKPKTHYSLPEKIRREARRLQTQLARQIRKQAVKLKGQRLIKMQFK